MDIYAIVMFFVFEKGCQKIVTEVTYPIDC